MPIAAELHLNLVTECIEKSLPFIGAGDKEQNSSGLPIPRIFLRNKLTLNCHNRRSMKLFSMFHWPMVALGYHVHCDQNKRTQRLFITLDLRYRVTVAEWPLWCFPLPTDTDTQLSRTLGPHGLWITLCYVVMIHVSYGWIASRVLFCFALFFNYMFPKHNSQVQGEC